MPAPPPPALHFVGRDRELAVLDGALESLRPGRGSLCLVSGEPGIGKTSLMDELGRRATNAGVSVLWGRCHEVEGRPPYWPWIQIVQAQVRASTPEVVAAQLDPSATPLGLLVPELRAHLDALAPTAVLTTESYNARFRLFQAGRGGCRHRSRRPNPTDGTPADGVVDPKVRQAPPADR